jgi:hypothetical protein
MKKLEDIPKKDFFTVPDGYFEKLTTTIQARVGDTKKETHQPVFLRSLKYALPVLFMIMAGSFWYLKNGDRNTASYASIEAMLDEIDTDDLVAYLDQSDLTTDEVLESVSFDIDDLKDIESEVYKLDLSDKDLEEILD